MFFEDCCIDIALDLPRIQFAPPVMVMACCSFGVACSCFLAGCMFTALLPLQESFAHHMHIHVRVHIYVTTKLLISSLSYAPQKSLQTSKLVDEVAIRVVERDT
uniref:Transmembrane protein n=1 Tax=Medicago truncatula TaxID=3880 RepID=A2Q5R2_MEDTR|nr:hypothetical protein MtrDRAFT_AC167711g34v2 [Medicago truncatula]